MIVDHTWIQIMSCLPSCSKVFHSLNIFRFSLTQTLHRKSHNFLTQLNGFRNFAPSAESTLNAFNLVTYSSFVFQGYFGHLNSPPKTRAPCFFAPAASARRETRRCLQVSRRCHSSVTGIPEGLIVPSHDLKRQLG